MKVIKATENKQYDYVHLFFSNGQMLPFASSDLEEDGVKIEALVAWAEETCKNPLDKAGLMLFNGPHDKEYISGWDCEIPDNYTDNEETIYLVKNLLN